MSASCEAYQELLSRMLDDDLTADERSALRAHVRACPDCQKLYRAYAALSSALREDMAEPPAALADGVMDRIYAWEEASAEDSPAPTPIRRAGTARKSVRRWVPIAAAACLAVVVGGAYLGANLLPPRGASGSAVLESITMTAAAQDAPAAEAAVEEPSEAPAPEPEEAEEAMDAGDMDIYAEDYDAPLAAFPETAAWDAASEKTAAANGAARASYTVDAPALVPAGREADFEALLGDARWPDGEPDIPWHTAAAVEYRGVIYEFMTDDDERYLLWQDAAEGMPVHSPGTPADLWDIIG